ncbi:MAG TPA: YggS family pyridoxal phosphate-dependent enzyme [Vicinamibacterales bacterium]|nr:YggS family pyridoxal phosphate-dependent enzyme [Vicinamibacterales bacterium]
MPPGADIASNLEDIGRRLRAAAARSGRNPDDILLVAVSKTVPTDVVRAAAAAGQRHFGENRVQEGLDKIGATGDLHLEWHLIGHLQSNKAKKAASAFAWIHSIDSVDLLRKVDSAAAEAGARPRVLIQVDLAHEATKFGADEATVGDIAKAAMDAKAVDLRGLMIVPPIAEDPEASRSWFRRLRDLRDALVPGGIPAANLAHLSMGMSHDFEVAIDEGATMVRVGTSIFGHRAPVA